MLRKKAVLEILRKRGAILEGGHFVYRSWRHGTVYIDKDLIYPFDDIHQFCQTLMIRFGIDLLSGTKVVVGPATGGIVLSRVMADCLAEWQRQEVLAIYAKKSPDKQEYILKDRYKKLIRGKKALLVDDVLNTGITLRRLRATVDRASAKIIGAAVLVNRGKVSAEDLDIKKLYSLIELPFDSWSQKHCPLCKQKIIINTEVGRGAEYLAQQK